MKRFLVILRTVKLDLLVQILGVSVPGGGALSGGATSVTLVNRQKGVKTLPSLAVGN